AGIIGACTALELQRDGMQVTLIESGQPGGPQSASFGNGAMLSTASTMPLSVPGMWRRVPSYLMASDGPLVIRWQDLPYLAPSLVRCVLAGATFSRVERASNALASLLRGGPERHRELAEAAGVAQLVRLDGIIYAYRTEADFRS